MADKERKDRQPPVTHCPFCGADTIRKYGNVPRCMTCRIVFFVAFSRYARRSPTKQGGRDADRDWLD